MNERVTVQYLQSRLGEVVRVIDVMDVTTFGFLEFDRKTRNYFVVPTHGNRKTFNASDVINVDRLNNKIYTI